ncbi:hypothetical protein EUX98_g5229 [Antrodiella citrinella]|uniref:AB hydrolase-1 domain-containing protein n=1 Tax=Antrodiella citrinella TaxID=2447956 RepID=A0A4S4MTX6_9APHY|nr:hypothetical protein EUX98_g5229 [Antrodiella citrinella]
MDPANYKDLVNSRGYKYHYYAVPAKGDNLTLVFVHGFPNTSRAWRLVAPFFEEKGYGVIVPDMLAYGGSDKPTDYNEYQFSLLNKDIVDLLDAEGVKQAVAVGHDWGAGIVSRLPNFFPDRFVGYAFLNVPWQAPNPDFNMEELNELTKALAGYEVYGYWYFFSEEGADKILEDHIESLMCALFPKVPHAFLARGELKESLLSDLKRPLGDFLNEEEQRYFVDTFRKGGFAAPLCYYKIMVNNARGADDATAFSTAIPDSQLLPPVSSPLFFGAALKDSVCIAAVGKAAMAKLADHNVTIKDFDGGHWLLEYPETAEAIRTELHAWLETVVSPTVKTSAV